MTTYYFVTGGNRGIGYSTVELLSKTSTNHIIATTRNIEKSEALKKLAEERKNISIITLDVSDSKSIATIPAQLEKITDSIDYFISNAGAAVGFDFTLDATEKDLLDNLKINTVGPILIFQKLYPFLKRRETKKVLFVTSLAGKFNFPMKIPNSGYSISKSALNFAQNRLSFELEDEGFTFTAYHPGFSLTDMATSFMDKYGSDYPEVVQYAEQMGVTPEKSAEGLSELISKMGKETNGKFYDENVQEQQYA